MDKEADGGLAEKEREALSDVLSRFSPPDNRRRDVVVAKLKQRLDSCERALMTLEEILGEEFSVIVRDASIHRINQLQSED